MSNYYLWGVLLFLLMVFILLRRRQPKNIIAYKTDNGNVTISRSAVVELVRTSCRQISQISKPRLKIYTRRGLTHVTIRIQLTNSGRLKDVEEILQSHLRESLSQNLGIENLGDINVVVTSFKSGKVRSTNSTSAISVPQIQKEDSSEDNSEEKEPTDESEKW